MKITEMTPSTLPASVPAYDYDWYQANLHAVETFGLLNAFEDREDRNRFRRIQKALNPVPAKVAKMTKVTVADLAGGVLGASVPAARLGDLPSGVREVAEEVALRWAQSDQPVPFPGVAYGPDQRTGKLTWWVDGDLFAAEAAAVGPMYTSNGKRCRAMKAPRPNGHRFHTASLRTVLYRLRRGDALFAAA